MSSGARGGDGAGQQPSASTSAQEQQPAAAQPPKRGRGRPRKAPQEPTGEPSPKRPRGRPKGSKNKSPSKAAQKKAEATGEKRPRGRPRKWNSYCRYSTPGGLHTQTMDWNINLTTPTEEGKCNSHRTAPLPQWSPHKRGKDSDTSHHDLSPNRVPLRGHCCSTLLPHKHQPQQVVQKKPTQEQTEETSSQESAEDD